MVVRMVVGIESRDVRAALFLALEAVDDVRIVGSATSAAEVVSLCRSLHPEVAIVEDLRESPGIEHVVEFEQLVPEVEPCAVIADGDRANRLRHDGCGRASGESGSEQRRGKVTRLTLGAPEEVRVRLPEDPPPLELDSCLWCRVTVLS